MALVHTCVWVVGSLCETPWGFLECRKDFSHPRDSCRMPGAPSAAVPFSSIPVIPQGKTGNFIILLLGLKFPSLGCVSSPKERQREINGMWVALLLIQGTKQALPVPCYWGNSSFPHIPFSIPSGATWGMWNCQFPRRIPNCCLIHNSLWCFRIKPFCRAEEGEEPGPAGAPGGTGTPGEVWSVHSSSSERCQMPRVIII